MPASDDEDDMPPLVQMDKGAAQEADSDGDDMPPLVADGRPAPAGPPEPAAPSPLPEAPLSDNDIASTAASVGEVEAVIASRLPEGMSQEEALRATAALQAAAAMKSSGKEQEEGPVDAASAIRGLLSETADPTPEYKEVGEHTKRMVAAISKDDFEECEDAIMQGADVSVDCGAGMQALHVSALRGEMFLTELLIAHGANVNARDSAGNTPLLYTCHFYRQHGRGVQMVSQLLYHKADPHFRVKEGKMAGKSAYDIMERCSREPNADESAPANMCAMLQLAMDGSESGYEAITKVWMQHKSQNKKLYSVSSKKDSFDYVMKNIKWETPENAKNRQASEPVRLESAADSILEEKFTLLKDYQFNDEGEKVKIYVNFPALAVDALSDKSALSVDFELQAFDLKLRTASESFRLRIEPLYGTIDAEQCKHRVSAASGKVTLTLAKRHKNRPWPGVQKAR